MLPIKTDNSRFIYRSSSPELPDMPGERIEPGHIRSIWELTDWERDEIFHGGNIELNIFAEPIPPVALKVTGEGARWGLAVLFAVRYLGDDGLWYVRVSFREGTTLAESKGFKHRWGAWLAQRRLKKILPTLEIWAP
ncbi:MAG: hypothetical protein H0U16_13135 [Actinobacteria bacterium]|nr:hypothetical protein [Actinomycetota bacterium]